METRIRTGAIFVSAAFLSVALTTAAYAVTASEDDNFEDGTTMDWTEGGSSPNKPTNESTGGPLGVGDNYLRNTSTGLGGAGSRAVMFNRAQWSGDYTTLGPTVTIAADFANFGTGALSLRVGVTNDVSRFGGTKWVTTSAVSIPDDGQWHAVTFTLSTSELTQHIGSASLASVLASALELRIIHSTSVDWEGAADATDFGMDNFRIDSVPVNLQSFSVE